MSARTGHIQELSMAVCKNPFSWATASDAITREVVGKDWSRTRTFNGRMQELLQELLMTGCKTFRGQQLLIIEGMGGDLSDSAND